MDVICNKNGLGFPALSIIAVLPKYPEGRAIKQAKLNELKNWFTLFINYSHYCINIRGDSAQNMDWEAPEDIDPVSDNDSNHDNTMIIQWLIDVYNAFINLLLLYLLNINE